MIKLVIFDFNWTVYNPEKAVIVDGFDEILARLKLLGISHALITTGKPVHERVILLYNLGVLSKFDSVAVMEDKTNESYLVMLKNFNLEPCEVAVVGDRVKKEIKIANKLGFKSIWICDGSPFASELPAKGEEPAHTIKNLHEIFDCIQPA